MMNKWEDTVMEDSQIKIWDRELPTFFKDDVIDPIYELETYGLSVAKAQAEISYKAGIKEVVDWLKGGMTFIDWEWEGSKGVWEFYVEDETWQDKLKEWEL